MQLNASIWAALDDPRPTGYIDLTQVEECLSAFHAGTLDQIPDLSRIYLPVEQLIDEKPLLSQVDSDLMRRCLYGLSDVDRNAIAYQHEPTDSGNLAVMIHDFMHSIAPHLEQYCREAYYAALVNLGEAIHKNL